MRALEEITPRIRLCHTYQFPAYVRESVNRRGYCYAFHLVLSGKGRIVIEGRTHPLATGDLAILRPGQLHSFYPDPAAPYATGNIYCELWQPQALDTPIHLWWDETSYDPSFLTPVQPCMELDRCPGVIPLHHSSPLRELFAHIVKQHGAARDSRSDAIVRSLLYGWILSVCSPGYADRLEDPRIRRCLAWMEANPGSTAKEWREIAGLGKSQFLQLFKQTTGMPPHAYREKLLLERASAELLESRRSVTEIADELGYSSIHYFSKRFRERFGVSPSQYRYRKK